MRNGFSNNFILLILEVKFDSCVSNRVGMVYTKMLSVAAIGRRMNTETLEHHRS